MKYLVYIFCLFINTSCLIIDKPFQNSKTSPPTNDSINSVIYIENIIGVNNQTNLFLKDKIQRELIKNNILASYKYFNKNSFIIKSTLINYPQENLKKIIFNILNKEKVINKLEIKLSNKNIKDKATQNSISIQLADFIEIIVLKLNKKKYLKVLEIKGLKDYKNLQAVFFNKLEEVYSQNSIQLLDKENIINKNFTDYSFIKIIFIFENIDKERIKINVEWQILDKNQDFIGSIRQENIIKKSILKYAWKEISNKIIEMSLSELNMLINL
ncbi:MAG: hypothetical protein CFH33_00177 [Alphaproteobacteria bacterium MarineAlpha9_Bin3]|nr:MAG: hypothetical protein CFH33_00177 [Alphaproteobacteria bacterium MarineAlpha9_Bin3]|tara:strand:- start:2902 stop:3714 length:813 start_codon:yes stop_codon:yes gene_type:complete